MQSPDFVFYLFVALAVVFGAVAFHARQRHQQERLAQAKRPSAAKAGQFRDQRFSPD